jgi:hypothetical protein
MKITLVYLSDLNMHEQVEQIEDRKPGYDMPVNSPHELTLIHRRDVYLGSIESIHST